MTAFKGTNGNDILVGTEHADRFTPLLGVDDVDGRGGVDTLVVDYSSLTNTGTQSLSYIFSNGSAWEGYLFSGSADGYVTFRNVEKIEAVMDGGNNVLIVFPAATLQGATLDLDGGAGTDTLNLQLSDVATDTVLTVAANGKVHSNLGKFANFEEYELFLGAGNHQITTGGGDDTVVNFGGNGTINTGAGDDSISSIGSIDAVDGGDGFDWWQGEYQESTESLTFTFDGSLASVSNGTTARNFESFNIYLGLADDHATITGGTTGFMGIYGGGGFDTLDLSYSGDPDEPDQAVFGSSPEGEIHGSMGPEFDQAFGEFESVNYLAGDGDSDVQMYLQGIAPGGELFVDGAGGDDSAYLLYWPESDASYNLQAGLLETDFGVTLVNFEYVTIEGVGGNDSFTATGDVRANFDGGWGLDSATIDFSETSENAEAQIFASWGSLHGWAVAGPASVSYNNVESVDLTLGDGFDLVTVGALEQTFGASISVDASGGRDRLDINLLDFGDAVFEADDDGSVTSNTGAQFANFEDYTVWLGASNNVVTTASGEDRVYSFFGGSSIVSTGAGNDYIQSWLSSDTIDGGDDYDIWEGDYAAFGPLTFTIEDGLASLSNGTTVENVENLRLTTGDFNDTFNLGWGQPSVTIDAGWGFDTINYDFSGASQTDVMVTWANGDGTIRGSTLDSMFDNAEALNFMGGSGDTMITLIGAFEAGEQISVDGGGGTNTLTLDLQAAVDPIELSVDEDGTITSSLNISGSNFQHVSLILGSGDDVVTLGTSGSVNAGAGDDVLNGGTTGSWLEGGEGDDIISGGDGFDFLVGGAGADRFVFQDGADEFILDFIWDFSSGQGDIIDLGAVDADANSAGDQAFTFIGTGAFSGTAGELRIEQFDPGQLTVQADMDGDGQAELWLNVQGPATLSASDFFL